MQRGPLVYCLEELDQPEGVSLVNVALDLSNAPSESFQSQLQADLLGGVVVLRHSGRAYENDTDTQRSLLRLQWSSDQKPPNPFNLHSVLRLG